MGVEMIKLNRIKYAASEEEKQALIREGYTPLPADQEVVNGEDASEAADADQDTAESEKPRKGRAVTKK